MRKQLPVLFLVLIFAAIGIAQDKAEHYVDARAGFSFDVPAGWRIYERPDKKYKAVAGPRENGFTPNISVMDDSCACTLSEYLVLGQRGLELKVKEFGFDSVKLVNKVEFTTASGLKGGKVTNAVTAQGRSFIFRQYVFESKEKRQKLIFTCASLAESAAAIESQCDAAMKTLSFTN